MYECTFIHTCTYLCMNRMYIHVTSTTSTLTTCITLTLFFSIAHLRTRFAPIATSTVLAIGTYMYGYIHVVLCCSCMLYALVLVACWQYTSQLLVGMTCVHYAVLDDEQHTIIQQLVFLSFISFVILLKKPSRHAICKRKASLCIGILPFVRDI